MKRLEIAWALGALNGFLFGVLVCVVLMGRA